MLVMFIEELCKIFREVGILDVVEEFNKLKQDKSVINIRRILRS